MKKCVIVVCILLAAGLIVLNPVIQMKRDRAAVSISIIGGADGPTSIFVAGKTGKGADNVIPATSSDISVESMSSEK